ncbi:MAG: hydantoinase/oxoprolinase family protein, partial [Gammaproteobacteria bacterium]
LNLTPEEAAQGIFRLVNSNMVNAIKVVSIERGIDPREYTLVVGGGAGAVHGGMLAGELGMKSLIVPRYAGVFCSYGMVVSDVRHDYMRVLPSNTRNLDFVAVEELYRALEEQAIEELIEEGFPHETIELTRAADAKYPSQIHELTIALPAEALRPGDMAQVERAFHELHEAMFSYSVRESSVDLFHWRLTAVGRGDRLRNEPAEPTTQPATVALKDPRKVHFGAGAFDESGARVTNIYDAARLAPGMSLRGPAVVEQDNTTIVVFPRQVLTVNPFGDFGIELE